MKKRFLIYSISVCMMTALCLMTGMASAVTESKYGVNMEADCYTTAANPYYPSYPGQCTWYVWGRAMEKLHVDLSFFRGKGNAERWYQVAAENNWPVGSEPRANSIAVFQGVGSKTVGIGHVVFVESVYGSTVYYTESNRFDSKGVWHDYYEDSFDANNPVLSPGSAAWEQRLLGYIYLDPAAVLADGIYTLAPQCAPNSRLDVDNASTENCANLQIYHENGTEAQQFRVTYLNNGYYQMTSLASGKAVDAANAATDCGTNVWQYEINHTNAQKWALKPAGGGYFYIVPAVNQDLCLDVSGASDADRTNVQIWTSNQTGAQKWMPYFVR